MIFKSVTLFTSATWFPQLFSSMVLPLLHHGLCSLKISSWIYRISSCRSNRFNPDFSDSMADGNIWKKGAPPHQLTSHSQPSMDPSHQPDQPDQHLGARPIVTLHVVLGDGWTTIIGWCRPSPWAIHWGIGISMATDFMKSEAWGSMIFRCQHLPIEKNPFCSSLLKGKHITKKNVIIQHLSNIFRKSHVQIPTFDQGITRLGHPGSPILPEDPPERARLLGASGAAWKKTVRHLVICYIANWKITMLLIGKPSISMGHVPWRTVTLPEGRFGLNFRNDEK